MKAKEQYFHVVLFVFDNFAKRNSVEKICIKKLRGYRVEFQTIVREKWYVFFFEQVILTLTITENKLYY